MSSSPPAKFFVNHGVVTSRTDMLHLLRPLLKQTVTYRYLRGRDVVAHGTGWMERIVFDTEETSTYFTPLAITLNIDSFEHLEFETRPDQLLVYTLVQGDERVIVEFAPIGPGDVDASPFAPRQLEFDTSGYVQMELQGLDVRADDDRTLRPRVRPRTYGRPSAAGAPTRFRAASRDPMMTARMTSGTAASRGRTSTSDRPGTGWRSRGSRRPPGCR